MTNSEKPDAEAICVNCEKPFKYNAECEEVRCVDCGKPVCPRCAHAAFVAAFQYCPDCWGNGRD